MVLSAKETEVTAVLIHLVFIDGGNNHYENSLYLIDKETEEEEEKEGKEEDRERDREAGERERGTLM